MADIKPGVLRNLRIKRVSLVDMGANTDPITGDGAHIMLYKRADVKKDGPFLAQVHVDALINNDKKKKKEPAVKNSISGFLKGLLGAVAETDPAVRTEKVEALAKAFPDDMEKVAHDPDDPTCKCADCMAKSAPEVAKAMVDLNKKYADLEKSNRDLAASNLAIQKALQTEIEKRADGEIENLLKSFKMTPFDLPKDIAVYRKMRSNSPELFERTMSILKAQDAMLASSNLMSDFGSGRVGEGSAWAMIEAKAAGLIEKSTDGNLTKEQAIEKVCLQYPELAAKYRAEQN